MYLPNQYYFTCYIIKKINESFDIDSLKSFFKQSTATLYRHINTLYNLGLIESTEEFSKRKVFQLNKHISFEEILLQMRTPIKDITFIKSEDYERVIGKNYHLFAGESALHPYNLIVDKTTLALSYLEMKILYGIAYIIQHVIMKNILNYNNGTMIL